MKIVLIISIFFQVVAVIVSVRLIKITKIYIPWLLVALAILLMAIRRFITLYSILKGATINLEATFGEYVALSISVLLAVGLFFMIPIFKSIYKNELELEKRNDLLTKSKREASESQVKFKKLSNLTFEGILDLQQKSGQLIARFKQLHFDYTFLVQIH